MPRAAAPCPTSSCRDDDLFLFDRFFHVIEVLGTALVHGRLDQFDVNLSLLERYPSVPIASLWRAGCEAVAIVLGQQPDEQPSRRSCRLAAAAPPSARFYNARAAVSVGVATRPPT